MRCSRATTFVRVDRDPIIPRSVVEDVLDHLRSMIHRGEIGPGGQLPPERVLASQLGVGRLSLREAIATLVDEGYVVSKRGAKGGTFVTELERPFTDWVKTMRKNPEVLADILEMRIALETRAAVLACERHTEEDLEEMQTALADFNTATSVFEKRSADNRFHHAVAQASASPRIIRGLTVSRGELFPPTHTQMYEELLATASTDHSEIVAAIADREPERAARAVEEHVNDTRSSLLALLEQPR